LLSALNVSVARMCCFSQISLVKKPVDSATLFQDIMKCDVDLRKNCTSGRAVNGTTMFQGIFERMTKVPTALPPSTLKINVFAPPM